MKKNLVLLGKMGVGKSTLGKIVAKKQGMEFIDTDVVIEEKCSMKISEIFEKKGEKFFRLEEKKEVMNSLKKNNSIIGLGGGAFLNSTIRNYILKNAISIWLDSNLEILNKRAKLNNKRPLINIKNRKEKIIQLYNQRKNIYKLANYRVNCDNLRIMNIAKKIINIYEK